MGQGLALALSEPPETSPELRREITLAGTLLGTVLMCIERLLKRFVFHTSTAVIYVTFAATMIIRLNRNSS